ncbi:hypothetical protein K9L97_05805 [Candidatus Woesearchaeota archaeon]|nr:hypothetical protein [Candidatus Woesearchaeota archaeon]
MDSGLISRNSEYVFDIFHFFSFVPVERKVFVSDQDSLDSLFEHFHGVFKSYFPRCVNKSVFSGDVKGRFYFFDDASVFSYINKSDRVFNVEIVSRKRVSEVSLDLFGVVNEYFFKNELFISDFDKRQSFLMKKKGVKGSNNYDDFSWRSGLSFKLNPEFDYGCLKDVV